ncbi:type IX secretion system sortase PorU [Mariniflexile ostreae]|uniref:Type IX secretion system sortase PorU n=1 Tax=Mariniflexile ostreae TaxID=1520892 RepID=A0ABV5FCW2_9FLAO
MKEKNLFVALFISVFVFSQQKDYTITWEGTQNIFTESYSMKVPAFNNEYFVYDLDKGVLFVDSWKVSSAINESSASIAKASYVPVSKNDLGDLDLTQIPNTLQFQLKNTLARGKHALHLEITPIIKDALGFKKLVSFTVNYNTSTSRSSLLQKNSAVGISHSVLSSGEWYRFYVDTTGVHKISKSFLEQLGVNVNTVNPKNIKLYGHGGHMLPYPNAASVPFDLPENAIKVVGEDDGVFNNQDYILFYAQGPKGFQEESNTHINCYTDKTYYYINISNGPGKRITPFTQPTGVIDMQIDTFQEYKFHEVDNQNIATLGRRWFGERFDIKNERTFNFEFPDLLLSQPIKLKTFVAGVSSSATSMQLKVNGNIIRTLTLPKASKPNFATEASFIGDVNVNSQKIAVNLTHNNNGNPSAVAYLDYIAIEATRALKFSGKQFLFKNNAVASTTGIGQYNIENASEIAEIWDVTDLYNVANYSNTNTPPILRFKATLGALKHYVAVSATDYFIPKTDTNTKVPNQNIKGTIFSNNQGQFKDIDYIIISPSHLLNQANRLAEINIKQYGLSVKVLSLKDIYTEFSSGNQDIAAIRNVIKYVYDNASAPEKRIKYVCLFGDGSFDYKDRIPNNTNMVPSWYSLNSFSETSSYVSDDFYGMMDSHEGAMETSDKLDIAIGRILADTPQRAKELVDKIEGYYAKEAFGEWRNNFVVVSDDVDKDWEGILQETTNDIADKVTQEKPFINVVKIHSDAFQQESSAGGDTYPKVNEALVSAIDNGALVFNYFGHGGEDGLAAERILLKPHIQNLRNVNKLNCFVTITCEFTKFDNPFRQTAGEFAYWQKQAGAIALITTTRQIFVTTGITFNKILGQYLFSFSNNDAFGDFEYPSMAEALRLAKNDPSISGNSQRRLVFFIGDPAMKLAFPKPHIKLTEINGVPIAQSTDTLKGLSYVKLAGEVTDLSGNRLPHYTGTLSTTIYDKELDRQTLANDGTRLNGELVKLDFKTLGEIIFRGQATVNEGKFEFDFVVPKDIGIPVGYGKISFYAKDSTQLQDQTGANMGMVKIGGLNTNAPEDNIGPVITLYMNDENFVSGGITHESPTLLVKLEDENGINTASGIGHDIVAILDGDEKNPFILNDYYQTEVDDYKKGIVSFPFRDLEPGLHTLSLKAWDVYNNSSVAEIQFIVFDKDQELVINNVLNYPNPFVNYTEFWFNHNSSAPLDVSIQIFTVSGKLVRTLNGQTKGDAITTSSLSKDIVWDGRDDFGDKIGKGVYIYKLTVRSQLLNKKVEKIEKLVIL